MHPTEKIPGVELALTVLHAGGKFDRNTYKVSGGLHGVGLSVVNALSERLEVCVDRSGQRHHMAFARGETVKKLNLREKVKGTGTIVRFKPDATIFTETRFDYDILASRLRELAFLNKGLTITFQDEREGQQRQETFFYKGGLLEFVQWLNTNKKPLHPKPILIETVRDDVDVQLALQYDDGYNENTLTFVNNINTHEGGTHLTGFKSALTRTINEYAKKSGALKKADFTLSGDDVREGLTAVLSVKVREPQFEGQTKTKLGNSEVEGIVKSVVNDLLGNFLDEHPRVARAIIEKAAQRGAGARGGAQGARPGPEEERRSRAASCPASWPTARSPIRRCARSTSSRATARAARPSRGATARSRPSCRCGARSSTCRRRGSTRRSRTRRSAPSSRRSARASAEDFQLEEARYHKIIIMTDADVDGAHIRTLLLTFFYKEMKQLIDAGFIYIAQPPLFRVARARRSTTRSTRRSARSTSSACRTARARPRSRPARRPRRRRRRRAARRGRGATATS